jgi:pyridoxine kinase
MPDPSIPVRLVVLTGFRGPGQRFYKGRRGMAVLSIQSHVVYGYAGNTAAVFPLQRLGREVWAINTVEFSNHTGYDAWRGMVLGAGLVSDLVAGLEERGVLPQCEAVLSGYLGDAEVGRAIIDAVRRVRAKAPGALYCCDPVLGDVDRGFYVKPGILEMFRDEVIGLADIITPNQFELEALTGIRADHYGMARRAIDVLHGKGPKVVLVTSYRGGDYSPGSDGGGAHSGARIGMLVSDRTGVYHIHTPELPLGDGISGSGDLTAAVFLSRYLETADVKRSLELTTASVFGVLKAAFEGEHAPPGKPGMAPELPIIRAQGELTAPSALFRAEKL